MQQKIEYEYDEEEQMTFEKVDTTWYIHPLYRSWAASEDGQILYLRKKILKPKMTDLGMVIYVSIGNGFELYLVQNFVFEVFNDIEEVSGLVTHIDGDMTNNSINNLELA